MCFFISALKNKWIQFFSGLSRNIFCNSSKALLLPVFFLMLIFSTLLFAGEHEFITAIQQGEVETVQQYIDKNAVDVNKFFKTEALEELLTVGQIAIYNGQLDILAKLMTIKGFDINIQLKSGLSLLHMAILQHRLDIVNRLLAKNIDVNLQTGAGETALCMAIREKDQEIITRLLEIDNIDLNLKAKNDCFPLWVAVDNADLQTIYALLKFQAIDVNQQRYCYPSKAPMTALDFAILQKDSNDANIFIKIISTLEKEKIQCVSKIAISTEGSLSHAALNTQSKLLSFAAAGQDAEFLKLLRLGVNPNSKTKDGKTPLHKAVESNENSLLCALYLIDYEAEMNAKDKNGQTALHLAASKGKSDKIKLLLYRRCANINAQDKVADINAQDNLGKTPLHIAVEENQEKGVRTLLKGDGIDVSRGDINGMTPYDLAMQVLKTEDGPKFCDSIFVLKCLLEHDGIKACFDQEGGLSNFEKSSTTRKKLLEEFAGSSRKTFYDLCEQSKKDYNSHSRKSRSKKPKECSEANLT